MPIHIERERIKPKGLPHVGYRFLRLVHRIEIDGVLQFGERIAWTELNSLFQIASRCRPIPFCNLNQSQRGIGVSVVWIQLNGALSRGKSLRCWTGGVSLPRTGLGDQRLCET